MRNRTHVQRLLLIVTQLTITALLTEMDARAQRPPVTVPNNDFILRASASEIPGVLARHGLTEVGRLDPAPPGEEVCLVRAENSRSPEQIIADLTSQESSVVAIEEVFLASLPESEDGVVLNQAPGEILGAMDDTSTVPFENPEGADRYVWSGFVQQAADSLVQASQARALENGAGAIVAVIDTGVDPEHPLLASSLVTGYDFLLDRAGEASEWSALDESTTAILDESTMVILDGMNVVSLNESTMVILDSDQVDGLDPVQIPQAFGHGTMVAGIVHLVAPAARIMPLRVFDGEGNASVFDIVRAIYYAVDNGATVINMSFSLRVSSRELIAAIDHADRHGVTVVASAGNDGLESMVFPAGLCNVLGVGSTDLGDYVSSFSNLGNDLVALAAPGENVITTYPGGGWAGASGTSFAAPWIAGTAALLSASKGDGSAGSIGFHQVVEALAYADPIFGPGASRCGVGRVDILSALHNVSSLPPTGSSGCSGSSNAFPVVTITSPVGGSSVTEGDSVTFSGIASDVEDGDLTADLIWSSDLDGTIGFGDSFSVSSLSPGIHEITATVADSVYLKGAAMLTLDVLTTLRDEFDSASYSGNDGSRTWTAPWQEVGESNGRARGFARVISSARCASEGCLRIGARVDDQRTVGDRGVLRAFDLSGASGATLRFDYRSHGGSAGAVTARVEASGDGGVHWTTLAEYPLDSRSGSQRSAAFALESFLMLSSAMQIRIVASGVYPEEARRYLYVDNLEIEAVFGGNPTD